MTNIQQGDCLALIKSIPDESIDCVVSDCPYKIIAGGIRVEYQDDEPSGVLNKRDWSKTDPKGVLGRGKMVVKSDGTNASNKWLKKDNIMPSAVKDGKMFEHNEIKFHEWLPEVFRVLKKGTHAYIMINSRNLKELQIEAEKVGFEFQNLLAWDKTSKTPNKYYMQQMEFILLLSKRPARNINDMGSGNLISIPNIIGNKQHPTQKPTTLMEVFIKNSTQENEIVLDPFMGSGSTALACLNTNRNFIGYELDQEYFEIARNRIENHNSYLL
jgi:site-specific DNA-methyltransferase (adenine-specific)